MRTTKAVDAALLDRELAAAGVPHVGIAVVGTNNPDEPTEVDVLTHDDDGAWSDLPPEAAPVLAKHDATRPQRSKSFEEQEDAERLRIITERAKVDPAYKALADLTLGKLGVQT